MRKAPGGCPRQRTPKPIAESTTSSSAPKDRHKEDDPSHHYFQHQTTANRPKYNRQRELKPLDYKMIVVEAVRELNEGGGSNEESISGYMVRNYYSPDREALRRAISELVEEGCIFVHRSSGRYVLFYEVYDQYPIFKTYEPILHDENGLFTKSHDDEIREIMGHSDWDIGNEW